ncbi:MAG: SirB2 family protein [Zoogloeaceae bacterium]|nr:SirB2 family protein [Zoogloeaceae bacterium]
MYYGIKHLHMLLAVVSILGFLLRGVWMMSGSALLEKRLVRVLPHVVDTLLLLSAIALAVMIAQYPFVAGWVTAKVLGLVVYIALGMIALRRGRTKGIRIAAFFAAIVVFAWIASVAVSKNPAGFLPL